jgi:hypothetical protein
MRRVVIGCLSVVLIAATHPPAHKRRAVASPPPIPATPYERAIGQALVASRTPKDEFSSPAKPDPAIDGTRFKIVRPISKQSGATAYAYKDGVLLLLVGTQTLRTKRPMEYLLLGVNQKFGAGYTAQNAYGAKVDVVQATNTRDGLALVSVPRGLPNPYFDAGPYNMSPNPDDNEFWVKLPMDGPAAKTVMLDTDVVLEGTYAALPDGGSATCVSDYDKATFTAPVEDTTVTCGVGARLQRVAFVRRSTNEVIREWVTP